MAPLILPYRGKTPRIHPTAWIAPTAIVIGDVEIGPETGIWYGCVVRGDVNEIRIGARTNIQDGTVIHVAAEGQGTYVGDEITVGHMALLHACTVESNAFVGMKSCVMDGAHVERHAMVAAGALVTPGKRVPSGELWGGSPARKIRDLTDAQIAAWRTSWEGYVAHAKDHAALSPVG
jgi:carbonic anhydrase/acetyltransferase-like protein (isoleucine patch superfamily)